MDMTIPLGLRQTLSLRIDDSLTVPAISTRRPR